MLGNLKEDEVIADFRVHVSSILPSVHLGTVVAHAAHLPFGLVTVRILLALVLVPAWEEGVAAGQGKKEAD
jgi:hypothetical protein